MKFLSSTIKVNFKRLTADQRITVSTYNHIGSAKELESFTETEEFLEFIMNRITNENFMETL